MIVVELRWDSGLQQGWQNCKDCGEAASGPRSCRSGIAARIGTGEAGPGTLTAGLGVGRCCGTGGTDGFACLRAWPFCPIARGLQSQCNPAIPSQWVHETADWLPWFYIPRLFCAPIAMGFRDCDGIEVGFWIAIGLAGLQRSAVGVRRHEVLGLPSQCNPAIRLQWARETADWPSWFYIPRPFCAPITMGFRDCTLIAVGLEMAIGL